MFSLLIQISVNDSNLRYAGYSAGFARAFRYLAFTSDFGEALRPVISSRLVAGEWGQIVPIIDIVLLIFFNFTLYDKE